MTGQEHRIQAVVLAGGLGTRLWPLTRRTPKPLVEVAGRPFLEHQIALLRRCGISRFLLLTGYLGSAVQEALGDGSRLGVAISYSHEESPLGTAGALVQASESLTPRFLLLNGDTYLDVDYGELLDQHERRERLALIVASSAKSRLKKNLRLAADGRVLRYDKDDPQHATHVDAGAGVFDRKVLSYIPSQVRGRQPISLEREVYPRLVAHEQLWAFPVAQTPLDMGTFGGLEMLKSMLKPTVP